MPSEVDANAPPVRGAALLLGLLVGLHAGVARAEEPTAVQVSPGGNGDPAVQATAVATPVYGPRRVARRGDHGRLHLRDGQVVEGRLVTVSDDGDVVDLVGGKRRVFPGHAVVEVEPIIEPDPWAGLREGEVRAILYDGPAISGRLLRREAGTIEVEEANGARRSIRSDEVRVLYGPAGPLPPLRSGTSPARTRNVWAQTAFILDPGEVTLTSSQLLTAQASAGLFRWTMFSAGTTVPVGYASDAGGNATLRLTVGARVQPWLQVAVGMEAWLAAEGNVISTFGAATILGEAWWGSAYLGPPPTCVDRLGNFGQRIFALSAGWRLTPRLSAVVEAWSGLVAGGNDQLLSAAARIRLWGLHVDAGVLTATGAPLVPVLSISGTLVSP